jgi:hypothetical protein
MAVNGTDDHFLTIKLTLQLLKEGLVLLVAKSVEDTYDIPPKSQRLLAVVSTDGKLSNATQLAFQYVSATIAVNPNSCSSATRRKSNSDTHQQMATMAKDIGYPMKLHLFAELLTNEITTEFQERLSDIVDTYLWIPQLGATLF